MLRANDEMILTVLEVFVHDPLYVQAPSMPAKSSAQSTAAPTCSPHAQRMPLLCSLLRYTWALSAEKIRALRQPNSAEVLGEAGSELSPGEQQGKDGAEPGQVQGTTPNPGAQRAMLNVKKRLRGNEHKDVLSVEGQVRAQLMVLRAARVCVLSGACAVCPVVCGNCVCTDALLLVQVSALIHEATDVDNLSRMYYGWCAWL